MKKENGSNPKSKIKPHLVPPDLEKFKNQQSQKKGKESHSRGRKEETIEKKKPSFFNKKSEVEELKKELKEIKTSYAYLQAEFMNFKKAKKIEREQSIKYASFPFLQNFLVNVLNDFNRAMEKEWKTSDFENFKSGIEMLHSKIIKLLEQYGVKEINPQGEIFNPYFHEVLSLEEDKNLPEKTILQVCKKGYLLYDRLVQPAQVIVNQYSINKSESESESDLEESSLKQDRE